MGGSPDGSLKSRCSDDGDFIAETLEEASGAGGSESELMKLSNFFEEPDSDVLSFIAFPRRLFGGGGGRLLEELDPGRLLCSTLSRVSSSSDVRGLSSRVFGMVSKSECCEIEAESALELLSLTD